jgi:uncharacterized protein DUF4112
MHGTTVPLDTAKQQSMARLEALARLMDGAFVLPGTTIRFGLDGIIGLIPAAGAAGCGWPRGPFCIPFRTSRSPILSS